MTQVGHMPDGLRLDARGQLLAGLVRAVPVVVGGVLGQDRAQVPLAEDQQPVGDLGPGGEYDLSAWQLDHIVNDTLSG